MYDKTFSNKAVNDLVDKIINLVNASIILNQQGYVVNKIKRNKLEWTPIFIHALENIQVLSKEQQASIERLYNNLFKL